MAPGTPTPLSTPTQIPALKVGSFTLHNRLIVGTGKYSSLDLMTNALAACDADVVTVAVRRERLVDASGRSLLDALDLDRLTILPNTAGCFTAPDAVRVARLGRDLLQQLGNAGARWVKLEVLGDTRTLMPDPVGTLEACRELIADGFEVLCYTSDDPVTAARLRDAGATSVMPAGSPIGSGRGICNPSAISIILEMLKDPVHGGARDFPVIVDAGVGTPSDVAQAMELGADGVLLNTGIAHAQDPVSMALAMKLACDAGYLGARAGRIERRRYGSASSPWEGAVSVIPGE
ncbi:MAG: thiazole synthase [Phycisphaerales bacterium]|nr:thiazole synthase [Phycisphaerales bacterium]